MTQTEAIQEMKQGHKVAHKYYMPGEYIYMKEDGKFYTSDGYILNWIIYRSNSAFFEGWYIFES